MDRLKIAEELHQLIMMAASSFPEETAMEIPNAFPAWAEDTKYKQGVYLTYGTNETGDAQLYRVLKNHWSNADKIPGTEAAAELYKAVGVSASGYPVWVEPNSKKDGYDKGNIVDRNGTLYQSNKNNNTDDPEENTGTWDVYTETEPEEPGTDYPEWVQPEDKKNAYNKGDIVQKNGVLYISTKNHNMDDPEADTGTWEVYTEPETRPETGAYPTGWEVYEP